MTRIVTSLSDIAAGYDAVYCDLWGCLHNGKTAFPAAVAALSAFRAGGGRVVLLTNAPRPAADVAAQLGRLGVPREAWDLIVTSGEATQYAMLAGAVGTNVWHLGADKDDGFFTDLPADAAPAAITRVPLDAAEGIVCTGLFDDLTETPEDYRGRLLAAKARGLRMLCANPDIVVDMGEKRLWCAGALARLYEEMGGESLYFGKPFPPVYDLARRRLAAGGQDTDPARILAIGDGIDTDIRGGFGEGIDTLFVTGGIAADAFGPDPETPVPELLSRWLDERQIAPTFAVGRLR